MKPRYIPQCKEVTRRWGTKMPMLCMEECAELIQAISKMERVGDIQPEFITSNEANRKQDLIDEIGDVLITIEAIKNYYAITDAQVDLRIETKLAKQYPLKDKKERSL